MASSSVKGNVLLSNKHPGVLYLYVIKYLETANCKFVLMADVVAIIVLADVMPKFLADVIAIEVC